MPKTLSFVVKWNELSDADTVNNIIDSLQHCDIFEVNCDPDFHQTTVTGFENYLKFELKQSFELVPNQVTINPDKSLTFFLNKFFTLSEFPQVLNFCKNHCSYIYDYIQDQNIQFVEISVEKDITHINSLHSISIKLQDFNLLKNYINEGENSKLSAIVFGALIKNFYQLNPTPFKIKSTESLAKIKQFYEYIDTLFNTRSNIVKKYEMTLDLDGCIINGNTFEYLNNPIITIDKPQLYDQNMDIKLLSYISRLNSKEIYVNEETNSRIL